MNIDDVRIFVLDTVASFNDFLPDGKKIIPSLSTPIFGRGGVLDSLSLVQFIVSIEQKIEDTFNKKVTLADDRAMSQNNSPFRSIESLINYIYLLLTEQK